MVTRLSYIDLGVGPSIHAPIIAEIISRRATHLTLHGNKISTLELRLTGRTKVDEALRNGACLEHLSELDLSSNCLHDGYSLPRERLGAAKGISLLGIAPNLCKLNLSSNGLSEKSFAGLVGTSVSTEDTVCLPRLHTLDISHNNCSRLPLELRAVFPSLRHLLATNNKIKSLSATLQVLHGYRGELESVDFKNNPVCSKDFYREKIVFVLGSSLSRLDCGNIGRVERDRTRAKLERGLPGYSRTTSRVSTEQEHVPSPSWRPQKVGQEECAPVEFDVASARSSHEAFDEAGYNETRECLQNDTANEKIKALEEQVAALSSLVEKQSLSAQQRCDPEKGVKSRVDTRVDTNSRKRQKESKPQASSTASQEQRAAAVGLLNAYLTKARHRQTSMAFAFALWAASAQFVRHVKTSKTKCAELEESWQKNATEAVKKAVSEEAAKGKKRLGISEKQCQAAKDEIKDLEQRLEDEKKSHRDCIEASDRLKTRMQRLEATQRIDDEKHKEYVRAKEAEIEGVRRELEATKAALGREQSEKAELASAASKLSAANQESKEATTAQAAELHKLQLEVIEKDTTIQRLKEAYGQAARKYATDRSHREQALAAESQAKDMLREQSSKLSDVEAELQKAKAVQHAMESEISAKSSTIACLRSEMEDRDRRVESTERRMKSILEERDELEQRLAECTRRNSKLELQLGQAEADATRAKRHSVNAEQLQEEISRAADLKRSLDRLRQTSAQKELELQARNEAIQRENAALQDDLESQGKVATSLRRKLHIARSEWKAREKQLARRYDDEKTKLVATTNQLSNKEQELTRLENEFKSERAIRLDIERKHASLAAENERQKLKMQNAIEGLAKQLSGG